MFPSKHLGDREIVPWQMELSSVNGLLLDSNKICSRTCIQVTGEESLGLIEVNRCQR